MKTDIIIQNVSKKRRFALPYINNIKKISNDGEIYGETKINYSGKYTSKDQTISFDFLITHEIETK